MTLEENPQAAADLALSKFQQQNAVFHVRRSIYGLRSVLNYKGRGSLELPFLGVPTMFHFDLRNGGLRIWTIDQLGNEIEI
jgi:hypothetical protein